MTEASEYNPHRSRPVESLSAQPDRRHSSTAAPGRLLPATLNAPHSSSASDGTLNSSEK
jgi:hypothetical protein